TILIGTTAGCLGQSLWLRDIAGREVGAPTPVDLAAEQRHGCFVRRPIRDVRATAVHVCSDGCLAVAVAQMAMAGGVGAGLDPGPAGLPPHAYLFGEDQGRYVVTVPAGAAGEILAAAGAAGVPAAAIGTTGGDALTLPGEAPISLA